MAALPRLIFAAAAVFCVVARAWAQVSPGPLSGAHQDLDGPAKCAFCHSFGFGGRQFKCLDCHQEIRQRLAESRGYHARVSDRSKGQLECVRCHIEHNGRGFDIAPLDRAKFDHRQTGYALEGKHAGLACERCHAAGRVSADERALIKVKNLNRTFLGLGTGCDACHADPHRAELGASCTACHSLQAWKPAAKFDHDRAAYALAGLHRNVACGKCHAPAAQQQQARYKGLPHASCQDCHQDPHRGAFKTAAARASCESCHAVTGWKPARLAAGFDHGKTGFPLRGKHATLGCFRCHRDNNFHRKIPHGRCLDCHQDTHRAQFAGRADGGDCSACHDESRFRPALFTRADHQKTAYPLAGKHTAVDCAKCHRPAGPDTVYKVRFGACLDCHADPHAGKFAARHQNRCESCHGVEGFKPSAYSLERHAQSAFPLEGAHGAVPCTGCHKPRASSGPASALEFRFSSLACASCHEDPHRSSLPCESCHTSRQWKELRPFNHSATPFPLAGAHATVACSACHARTFRNAPRACTGCHTDVHAGQFATPPVPKDCVACHAETKWNVTSFQHRQTAFPLDGAHRKAPCAGCHKDQVGPSGRVVRTYRGAPRRCADCHSSAGG